MLEADAIGAPPSTPRRALAGRTPSVGGKESRSQNMKAVCVRKECIGVVRACRACVSCEVAYVATVHINAPVAGRRVGRVGRVGRKGWGYQALYPDVSVSQQVPCLGAGPHVGPQYCRNGWLYENLGIQIPVSSGVGHSFFDSTSLNPEMGEAHGISQRIRAGGVEQEHRMCALEGTSPDATEGVGDRNGTGEAGCCGL